MPTEKTQSGFSRDAAEALIQKTLAGVRSVQDPSLLNACRSLFRSKVPFYLRSYVAAALILQFQGANVGPSDSRASGSRQEGRPANQARKRPQGSDRRPAPAPAAPAAEKTEKDEPRLKKSGYTGEGTTLFFSMGRRQHFLARNVLRVLSNISGIEESDVGIIRTFDNYTFVNVHPAAADLIIQDLDGTSYKGRKLVVNPARPKKDASSKPIDAEEGGNDEGPMEPTGDDGEL